jgi:hypothetical protein
VPEKGRQFIAPFGDAYEKIGTIQRRLAWPLHKDDTLFQSGRPTGLNIYFLFYFRSLFNPRLRVSSEHGVLNRALPGTTTSIGQSNRRLDILIELLASPMMPVSLRPTLIWTRRRFSCALSKSRLFIMADGYLCVFQIPVRSFQVLRRTRFHRRRIGRFAFLVCPSWLETTHPQAMLTLQGLPAG